MFSIVRGYTDGVCQRRRAARGHLSWCRLAFLQISDPWENLALSNVDTTIKNTKLAGETVATASIFMQKEAKVSSWCMELTQCRCTSMHEALNLFNLKLSWYSVFIQCCPEILSREGLFWKCHTFQGMWMMPQHQTMGKNERSLFRFPGKKPPFQTPSLHQCLIF